MNAAANVAQVEQPDQPAIRPLGEVAPVVPAGIENKQNVATDEQVRKYCEQVIAGKPTGKIFPSKLSEMAFTPEHREWIRGARAEHKLNCMNAKKNLLAIVRSRQIETVGHRTNKDGSLGSIRYAKREKVTHSFLFGAEPKN